MLRALVVVICWLALCARAAADPATLLRGLDSDDPRALAAGVAAIEAAPTTPDLADVLFAAGRACEDRLHDPARALAIYERIVRELPDARVSIAAARRADQLRFARGHAREAADLARLIADADKLAPEQVERRADALGAAAWPGALDARLFVADWLCRTDRHAKAQARYAALIREAPDAPQTRLARRNAAGCAIEAREWARAEQLANALPRGDEVDEAVRASLLDEASSGRLRDRLYGVAWLALAVGIALLLASLAEAMLRGGLRWPAPLPPIEVMFIAPVAALVIAASFAVERVIAPAVVRICLGGIGLAWLSGSTLDLLRLRGRDVRVRALVHILACVVGVVTIGYIAITHDDLLDMFSETVKYGPGA